MNDTWSNVWMLGGKWTLVPTFRSVCEIRIGVLTIELTREVITSWNVNIDLFFGREHHVTSNRREVYWRVLFLEKKITNPISSVHIWLSHKSHILQATNNAFPQTHLPTTVHLI